MITTFRYEYAEFNGLVCSMHGRDHNWRELEALVQGRARGGADQGRARGGGKGI